MVILYVFVINARTRRIAAPFENKFYYYTAFALSAGTIGYIIASFFLTVLHYPMIWMQLAMSVIVYELSKRKEAENKQDMQVSNVLGRGSGAQIVHA